MQLHAQSVLPLHAADLSKNPLHLSMFEVQGDSPVVLRSARHRSAIFAEQRVRRHE
ncbi:hypothetical protein EVJ58_g8767 [Rhodofomes roseus]|uniref:Uncharacterized protein n=1 Tax=Rhodofomes roseus TaxID=34475 RepID=A0A4Y9XWY7_9APHY|nr:hypothetical protein EVJ58_g8767 [Rhodofomes roseus]